MSRIATLLETEETKAYLENNEDKIEEMNGVIGEAREVLRTFVHEHIQEFMAENIEETKKNIRVFMEVATAQFVTEVTHLYSGQIQETEQKTADKLNEYI